MDSHCVDADTEARRQIQLVHSKMWSEARSRAQRRGLSWLQVGEGHHWLEHTFRSADQAPGGPELLSLSIWAWFSICSMLRGSCGQNVRATQDTLRAQR